MNLKKIAQLISVSLIHNRSGNIYIIVKIYHHSFPLKLSIVFTKILTNTFYMFFGCSI